MDRYKRKNGETRQDHWYRLVEIKKSEAPRDLKWEDIAEYVGWEGNPDSLRKASDTDFGGYAIWNYLTENGISDESAMEKMIQKEIDVKKERTKLSRTKLLINEQIRTVSDNELIMEQIKEEIAKREPLEVPEFEYIPSENLEKEAITGIADVHYDKQIKIKGLNGEILNFYGDEEFENRMWRLQENLIIEAKENNIGKYHFYNLGDSLDGMLRMSALRVIKYGLVESTIRFANFMGIWLNELSKHVHLEYYSVAGNHTEVRPLGSKSGEFSSENMEHIIVEMIKKDTRNNDRIKVHNCEPLIYHEILGKNVLASHGQNEKNTEQALKDYAQLYDIKPNIFLTGHYHTPTDKMVGVNSNGVIELIQFPSLCGVDEYAIKLRKLSPIGTKVIYYKGKNKYSVDIIL